MPGQTQIQVLTVDDHPLLRAGLSSIVNSQPDMHMVAHAATGSEAIERYRQHRPDVTLLDLRLPDMSGIDVLIAIRTEFRSACIVMLTTSEGDFEIRRALKAGANGYILKSAPSRDLLEAIRQSHAGKKCIPPEVAAHLAQHMGDGDLTTRELEVLRQLASGDRNRDIAERLFISEETVKVHLKHLMDKLGAADRTEAMMIAVRRGFMQL